MENLDLLVLRRLRDWRLAGRRALLATVVRTWGSSPRPVGSTMALCEDGSTVGSVSGGCIEDDLLLRHRQWLAQPAGAAPPPSHLRYGIDAGEAHRFGLPCGGTLALVLEHDPAPQPLQALVEALDAGQLTRRTVQLSTGAVVLAPGRPGDTLEAGADRLAHTFGPAWRMLLIGAGNLSEYLATMALFSGFTVTVCDPRAEQRQPWQVAGVRLVADMPDDAVDAFRPDARSCVVALTHDPKLDDLALLSALDSGAFYVGAIGSRRNNAARRERLATHFGYGAESLARLRGPIGIYIGSKTPPEIAVSVMAEILAARNGVALPPRSDVARAKAEAEAALGAAA